MASILCFDIDNTFGPYAGDCRGGFDFTLLFEESILTLFPVTLLLLVAPARIYYLLAKQTKVHRSWIVILKLCLYAIYGALQLALLVLWAGTPRVRTNASVPTAAIAFVASLVLPLLSYAEHYRAVRPSSLLGAYLFTTLFFDIAHTRTLWLQQNSSALVAVTTASVLVKVTLLIAESIEKRRLLLPKYLAISPPEATAGFFNRLFFVWLNGLFRRGFSKYFQVEDLFVLDKHLSSEYLGHVVRSAWAKGNHKGPNSLLFTFFKAFKWPLLSIVFPRLCLIGCNFAQPFLISNAIALTSEPVTSQTTNTGYGLIGAYILVYTGIAVSTSQYQHLTFRAITMARGGLVSMLYSKTSELSITAVNPSASLTLMSADIERITNGWQSMNEIWANALEVALALYLLARQLGAACALPVAVAVLSVAGSIVMTNYIMSSQAVWLEAIERRIEATTAMLGSMKGVKMCGLTEVLMTNIHNLRIEELSISKKFRRLLVWNLAFAYFTPILGPVLTFAVYSVLARNANDGTTLDTSRAFTAMSLFALLADPLSALIMAVAQFAGSIGSFARIQEFLDGAVREDRRSRPSDPVVSDRDSQSFHAKSSLQSSESENEKISSATAKAEDGSQSIADQNAAITVQGGCFGWTEEKPDLLSHVDLVVPRGKLTLVVGPVGCGKSTLLKALLGEVPYASGSVHIRPSQVAFCDQTPWHMNGTIEQSILAVSDMDRPWYKAVVRACSLDEDLRQLPKGDQTLIGSKGIALSGGQSQRIALARAIYSQKDLYILDDVLSGLDATTETKVFHNLLGTNGLLRRQDATVVIASSSSKRLAFADMIVALDADGKIAEQGTFGELDKLGSYVSSFGLSAADWGNEHSQPQSGEAISDKEKTTEDATDQSPDVKSVVEFDDGRATGDVTIYLYYVGSVGWIATIIFVIAISTYAFAWTFPTVWVQWWAGANSKTPNANLGYWLGIYALLGVGAIVSLVVCVWQMLITMVPKSGENFHWSLLKTVLHAPMSFFATTDTGVTLNRFSQDLQLIDMDLPLAALNTVATLVLCIAQMVLIGVESIYAAISFPICIVAVYFIQRFYLRTSRQIRFLDLEAKSPLYSQFVECLNGLATIRAFGWQNALADKSLVLLDRSQRPFYLMYAIQRWLILVLELVVAAIAVLLIVLVVVLRGTISAGAVGVALVNVILFSQNIQLLLQFWTTMETHIGAITRIKKFTEHTQPEDLPREKEDPPATWPASGAIEFEKVSAAYDISNPVVKNVTLSIEAGQKVAICGRTGSGKSSLISSLFRMIDVTDGTIFIDGIDISTIPRQQLRSRINGVPQDSYVLRGSVRFNADPTQASTEGSIREALKNVQLWETIEAKGGLDASIEKVFLSHGQKQLFCLARAMLRPSTILVLDEATSSVDSKTDELMQSVIRQKFSHHTIIAVAHKLDTILDFDNVAVLDRGTLVEYDSPHKLLAKKQSEFGKLFHSFRSGQKDQLDSEGIGHVT